MINSAWVYARCETGRLAMLPMLLMLFFGKMQDHVYQENSRSWQWAACYAGVLLLVVPVTGGGLDAALASTLVLGLYAWGYFALLRYFADSLLMWLLVYAGGVVMPILFLMNLAAKAQPV